jgi:hypothetical protein
MSGKRPAQPRSRGLRLREVARGIFEFVHPPEVEETQLDYEEAIELLRTGEHAAAKDALRFALEACGDNVWVHLALGQLALEQNPGPDVALARGHFGYIVELAERAAGRDFRGRIDPRSPRNEPIFEAVSHLRAMNERAGRSADAARLDAIAQNWSGGRPFPPKSS